MKSFAKVEQIQPTIHKGPKALHGLSSDFVVKKCEEDF